MSVRGCRTLQMVSLLQLNFLPPTFRLTMGPLSIVIALCHWPPSIASLHQAEMTHLRVVEPTVSLGLGPGMIHPSATRELAMKRTGMKRVQGAHC